MKSSDSTIAVIDIGSHAVRLFIGQVIRKGKVEILDNLWLPIAVGDDTFSKNIVSNNTINELINIFNNFKTVIESYHIKKVKAVATTALREASNSDILIDRIKNTTGIQIEIIEPITETLIIYKALRNKLKKSIGFKDKNIFIFIIGAGTAQIIFVRNDNVIFCETYHMGTLRIRGIYVKHRDSFKHYIDNVAGKLYKVYKSYCPNEKIDRLIVVNDDLLEFVKNVPYSKTNKTKSLYRFQKKSFNTLLKESKNMLPVHFQKKYKLQESNLDTTIIAFSLTKYLYSYTKVKTIIFPELSFSSAILWKLSSGKNDNIENLTDETKQDIISSAVAIAGKYKVDLTHAVKVKELAIIIFEEIRKELGLEKSSRLYLEVAAILHNIGKFIGFKSHHKNSALLISGTEILGLNKEQLNIIAQIARYHRRATPKDTHTGYTKLSTHNRITVSRLAAILKIATAFYQTGILNFDKIKINIEQDKCIFQIKLPHSDYGHFDLIETNVKERSDFFEKFYGLKVKLEKLID